MQPFELGAGFEQSTARKTTSMNAHGRAAAKASLLRISRLRARFILDDCSGKDGNGRQNFFRSLLKATRGHNVHSYFSEGMGGTKISHSSKLPTNGTALTTRAGEPTFDSIPTVYWTSPQHARQRSRLPAKRPTRTDQREKNTQIVAAIPRSWNPDNDNRSRFVAQPTTTCRVNRGDPRATERQRQHATTRSLRCRFKPAK